MSSKRLFRSRGPNIVLWKFRYQMQSLDTLRLSNKVHYRPINNAGFYGCKTTARALHSRCAKLWNISFDTPNTWRIGIVWLPLRHEYIRSINEMYLEFWKNTYGSCRCNVGEFVRTKSTILWVHEQMSAWIILKFVGCVVKWSTLTPISFWTPKYTEI